MATKNNALIKEYEQLLDNYGIADTWLAICCRYIDDVIADVTVDRQFYENIPYNEVGTFISLVNEESVPAATGENRFGEAVVYDDKPDALFGELYEYGLAYMDKDLKRKLGQYYTPLDTALLMSKMLAEVDGIEDKTLIEPCCGCGNLIVPYMRYAYRSDDAWKTLTGRFDDGRAEIRLYDLDETSMLITKTRLISAFAPAGSTVKFDDIASTCGDFLTNEPIEPLDKTIVIMNPPYGRTDDANYVEYKTFSAKDLYPLFMEKLSAAYASVSITPQSFLGAAKMDCLRKVLSSNAHGSVLAYDNVPAPMFNGRKKGVFNTNQSNSVRAAITLMEKGSGTFKVSPLLRWATDDRAYMLSRCRETLEGAMESSGSGAWLKSPATLVSFYKKINNGNTLDDIIVKEETAYKISVPSTPRYFVTGAVRDLDRGAQQVLYFENEDDMLRAYLILNSSVSYGWWRINDGGITITGAVLRSIPLLPVLDDKQKQHAREQIALENSRVIVKMNAGKPNENIKIGSEQIDANNRILCPDETEKTYRAMLAQHSPDIKVQFTDYIV